MPYDPILLGMGLVFNTIRPEMITQIIQKRFVCVTDMRVIEKRIPQRILMCNWRSQKAPQNYIKELLPERTVYQMSCAIGSLIPKMCE